jgi:uncharacterized transporter YbjL
MYTAAVPKERMIVFVAALAFVASVGILVGGGFEAVFNAMGTNGYLVFAVAALVLSAWMWFSAKPRSTGAPRRQE